MVEGAPKSLRAKIASDLQRRARRSCVSTPVAWMRHWYKHHDRDHNDWNDDGGPVRYYYSRDCYPYVRHVIVVRGLDPRTRHIILYDDSDWVVAPYDVPRCHDWEWDRDRVYVCDDYSHPGWYVLFNSRLGRSIHAEFYGM